MLLTLLQTREAVAVEATVLFDTHDGRPRINWEAREERERDEKRKTRNAIERAMRTVLGIAEPTPEDEPTPPSLPPKPLNRTQVRTLAESLVETTPAIADYSLRDIEQQIRAIESEMRQQEADRIAFERELEEEDELILLWAA